MQISVTKPIEEFINRQLTKGYSDPSEVARQAFFRWMEDEEFDLEPRSSAKNWRHRTGANSNRTTRTLMTPSPPRS